MEMDAEYLKLFEKIKKDEQELTPNPKQQMLKETGNYDNLENVNEVNKNPYDFNNFNSNEFNIETKVDGMQIENQNLNEVRQIDRESKQDKLNEVMRRREQERLNEVKRIQEQERLDEIKRQEEEKQRELQEKQEEMQKLNENVDFNEAGVVTLEMFNTARYNSMVSLRNRMVQ